MLYSQDAGGAVAPVTPPPVNPGGPHQPTGTASAPAAPASTPAPAPTVNVAGTGYTPDYTSLIQNDPAMIAAKNQADAAGAAAAAARQARMRALFTQFGGDMPAGFADQFGDIDQATKDAAAANQNSTIARLKTNYQQSVEQFRRALAARGALQSSDLDYGQDQLSRGLDQQEYDAANQFLNDAGGAYGDYLGVLQGNAANLTNAIGSAESSVYSNPAYRPSPAQTANYDAATSSRYGVPVYSDGNGNYYDVNGNPWSPPTAAPDPTPAYAYPGSNIRRPGVQLADY